MVFWDIIFGRRVSDSATLFFFYATEQKKRTWGSFMLGAFLLGFIYTPLATLSITTIWYFWFIGYWLPFIGVIRGFSRETDTARHLDLVAFNSITPFTPPHAALYNN